MSALVDASNAGQWFDATAFARKSGISEGRITWAVFSGGRPQGKYGARWTVEAQDNENGHVVVKLVSASRMNAKTASANGWNECADGGFNPVDDEQARKIGYETRKAFINAKRARLSESEEETAPAKKEKRARVKKVSAEETAQEETVSGTETA